MSDSWLMMRSKYMMISSNRGDVIPADRMRRNSGIDV